MKIRPIFVWYDLWIGAFIDMKNKCVYIFPFPMLGFVISWRKNNFDAEIEMPPWKGPEGIRVNAIVKKVSKGTSRPITKNEMKE